MKAKLEELHDYKSRIVANPVEALKTIMELVHDPVKAKYPFASLTQALRTLLITKQKDREGLVDYTERFRQVKSVLESNIGTRTRLFY